MFLSYVFRMRFSHTEEIRHKKKKKKIVPLYLKPSSGPQS
jgi:hypothetical protein